MRKFISILVALCVCMAGTAHALEQASYDSAGKLTGLIHDGTKLDVRGGFVVRFEGAVDVDIQPRDQRSPITRDGLNLKWQGTTALPNGRSADFAVSWTEDEKGVAFGGGLSHSAPVPLDVLSVEYVIDIPREVFVGGHMASADNNESLVALSADKTARAHLYDGVTREIEFRDATQNWSLGIRLDAEHPVTLEDRWDEQGRSYRVRIRLAHGQWAADQPVKLGARLVPGGTSRTADVALSVDPQVRTHDFDGFGGNYCWATDGAVTGYMLKNLQLAWSRHELKAIAWDKQRNAPDAALRQDFERIAQIDRMGVPWIISLWRVPERFYQDANRHQPGTFGRKIVPERWDELLELLGSYLQYIRQQYGVEPDLFSFNEPDLGVDIGLSPTEHRDAIKRIGAYLQQQGFRTKMLLGDTANPRDTHSYVLPTAADPQAMQYVGALSFHSWGNGSPAQYAAWRDVAQWLKLPLLVGEAGVDPGAYRNRNYDSYDYGLQEAQQLQNLLRYAKPQSSLYWQFTQDYALARPTGGDAVLPTGRFWMMKHFTNLTPQKSTGVQSDSDQEEVLISAFRKGDQLVVHIVNTGPTRKATLQGLPGGRWNRIVTTESQDWQEQSTGSISSLQLPARSVTTLVRK